MQDKLVELFSVYIKIEKRNILENISLEIHRGEIVSIIGLNGSGKTTLLRAMLGLIPPSKGKVRRCTRNMAYVPQKLEFDKAIPLSVGELLTLYSDKSPSDIKEKLQEMDALRLFNQSIGSLSGGELQRVLLANALLQEPELLLLDEATSGIDIIGEQNFYDTILSIHQKYNMSIVMVSHDIHTVFAESTRVLCLSGHICCQGTPKDVSNHPEFTKIFGSHLAPYKHHHDHKHN